jgi:hypothetical protein
VTWLDLAIRRTKLAAIKRRIWWTNPHYRFTGISSRVPEQKPLEALKGADLIVGCVQLVPTFLKSLLDIASRTST